MKSEIQAILILFIFLLSGCAVKSTWTSNPVIQAKEVETYELMLEPLKQGHDFFVAFKIMIKNKTNKELVIDWNKTQYIYAGKPDGVFVFLGIDPTMLKNKTVPADIIPPNGFLTKEIVPAKRVALAPLRENLPAGKPGISAGILPPGQNGVLLFVRRDGLEISQQITVQIIEEKLK